MNDAQLELFRAAILRLLDANSGAYGLTAGALATLLVADGFSVPASEVAAALDWLLDRRFVALTNKPLAPEARAFRITREGRHQI